MTWFLRCCERRHGFNGRGKAFDAVMQFYDASLLILLL